ncbi:isocitrate lyase/phosphoenolpyruvate mutase family protein [Psychrobium sp. 1_MG-2023]|uniref:isocitrate lyase/PEP mutase family protein n=1 Tax=Psychrobium sp. 1_MG-2023 TaxID=3062624 RepID=UPI000C32F033|nr:isocitrate lyase/phosphoenolpyruvate mutase family protein [Psychrobium sp. 1_MG-2023]MDP2562802.1 isocitrate lyase/phosphoenolpyruvate mutase family protein [Psychrobium sp. 1_MG-2023]PKF54449.1 isocitrate lyase/phosphoenolpyruvate mutase family protein [Alteromonadales bacterium alter-6D02]
MKTEQFNVLHYQTAPLVICNVWDVASAIMAEKSGFEAIGTSSAAIAGMLGYADGEEISFDELLFIVKRIASCSNLPLTVDIEAGYSDNPIKTAGYIKQLANVGVVGINIEDSKVDGMRQLVDENQFADYLSAIKTQLNKDNVDMFINVRTDTFILAVDDVVEATNLRIKVYEAAGADGIFVPCITQPEHISALVRATSLPINVMCMPQLPDFELLTSLGVKRISMGSFAFDKLQDELEGVLSNIKHTGSFATLF